MHRSILLVLALVGFRLAAEDLRLGMVGLDTSHVTAFTEILNNPKAKGHVPGARVVAAFKGAARTFLRVGRGWTDTRGN